MTVINMEKNPGFTLIELLMVVVILSVLAAVAIPRFGSSTDPAKVVTIDSTLASTRTAIDMYYQDHGEYPAALETAHGTGDENTQGAFEKQLTLYTNADGYISNKKDATHVFGPYLKNSLPADPITGTSTVAVVTTGSLDLNATGVTTGGWKYDSATGGIIMNHENYDDR